MATATPHRQIFSPALATPVTQVNEAVVVVVFFFNEMGF
jgi:hypothetical protein